MIDDAPDTSGGATGGADSTSSAFLRLLAHELRNYMAPMHNAMHLLRLKSRTEPTLAPVIDIVERQLKAMSGTLDAVGEMDRVRRGEVVLDRAPVALSSILERAVQSLPPQTADQRERIDMDVDAHMQSIDVDAARMIRVIASVLDNALRYAPRDSAVQVMAHGTAQGVEIVVQDNGPGMPANERRSAVEFFATPHRTGHGLGLGLPLAASIVRLHGGTLTVEQAASGGTRVVIRLPQSTTQALASSDTPGGIVAAAPDANDATDATESAGPTAGRRVLLADDSAAVRASLTDLLEELGHEVRAVADGAEAVSVAQAWHPEFVLLDIHMPKLNGFDAARKLRALYPSSAMKLVMMSGDGLDEVVRHGARQAGFDHCVDKGLAIGELATLLSRAPTTGQPRQNSL